MLPLIVKIIGIFIIIMSVICIIKPAVTRALIKFFIKGSRIYFAGIIRLIFAVIFLLAASQCKNPVAIIIFGLLMLLGAILVFVLGPIKINRYLSWWQERSDTIFRIIYLVGIAIGSAIIYFA